MRPRIPILDSASLEMDTSPTVWSRPRQSARGAKADTTRVEQPGCPRAEDWNAIMR
jgi:hypothetical protein